MKQLKYAILTVMILFSASHTDVMANDGSILVKAILWPVFLPIELVKMATEKKEKRREIKPASFYKFLVMCRDVDRKVVMIYFGPANSADGDGVRYVITPTFLSGPQKFDYRQSVNPREKILNEEEFAQDFFNKKVLPTTSQYDLVTQESQSRLSIEYSHAVTGAKILHQAKMIGRDRGQAKMICTFDPLPINKFMQENPIGERETSSDRVLAISRGNVPTAEERGHIEWQMPNHTGTISR